MATLRPLPILLIAAGFGLGWARHAVGATQVGPDLSADTVLGLLLMPASLGCYLASLLLIWRDWRAERASTPPAILLTPDLPRDAAETAPFDPDAALARYMARKQAEAAETGPAQADPAPAAPVGASAGFGRKRG